MILQKETALYDEGKIQDAIDEAKTTATDYLVSVNNGTGLWVTPSNRKPDANGNATSTTRGWHIADALELVKDGASYIKAWVESNVAKVRIGREDSGHIELDPNGIQVYKNDSQVASFGNTIRLGRANSYHVDISSQYMRFMDNSTCHGYVYASNGGITIASSEEDTEDILETCIGIDTDGISVGDETGGYAFIMPIRGYGTTELHTPLKLSQHTSAIGSLLTNSTTSKTLSSGTTWTSTGVSVTLPAGSWMVSIQCKFPQDNTGRRGAILYVGSTGYEDSSVAVPAVSGGPTRIQSCTPVVTDSSTTATVYAFQNSGSQQTISAYIRAMRIE